MVDGATVLWGPVVSVLLTAAIGILVYFVRTVSRALAQHGTALAVLVSETRPGLKLVGEVMDLKLASAELNESMKSYDRRITSLENSRENRR